MATHFRACNLCEATCGLKTETDGPHVVSIRGDGEDPLSRGHLCPKGVALQDVHEDENRLRHPILKTAAGGWEEVSWEAAFDRIAARASINDLTDDLIIDPLTGNAAFSGQRVEVVPCGQRTE